MPSKAQDSIVIVLATYRIPGHRISRVPRSKCSNDPVWSRHFNKPIGYGGNVTRLDGISVNFLTDIKRAMKIWLRIHESAA